MQGEDDTPQGREEAWNSEAICQARVDRRSAQLEQMWRQSGNPLYVFDMIRFCQDEAMTRDMGKDIHPWKIVAYPFPRWVMSYLFWAAMRLQDTMLGRDPDQMPQRHQALSDDAHEQLYGQWLDGGSIDPDRGTEKLARIMGFAKKGWNAFADHRAHQARFSDLDFYYYTRSKGASDAEAITALMEWCGVENERTVRRRLAEARERIGRRAPWEHEDLMPPAAAEQDNDTDDVT